MKKIVFTLEAENFDDFEGIELNFRNKDKYDYTVKSTYDEDGRPIRIVSEYTYDPEVWDADRR